MSTSNTMSTAPMRRPHRGLRRTGGRAPRALAGRRCTLRRRPALRELAAGQQRGARQGPTRRPARGSPPGGAATSAAVVTVHVHHPVTLSGRAEDTTAPRGLGRTGRRSGSEQLLALEDAQLLDVQLDVHAVGVAEVDAVVDAALRADVLDARGLQLHLRRVEIGLRGGQREVLHAADRLLEIRVVVAGEVEEAEQVAVADVEEEVAGPLVVAVLDQLHQGEPEDVLVEADGLLDVLRDQREVVDAAHGARRTLGERVQVGVLELLAAGADGVELGSFRLRHGPHPAAGAGARQGVDRGPRRTGSSVSPRSTTPSP